MKRTKFNGKKVKKSKHNPNTGAYEPWMADLARELVGKLGARRKELALFFDVAESTISNWIMKNPEFATAVNTGKVRSSYKVAEALYNKAIGAEVEEEVVIQNVIKEYHENGKLAKQHTEPIIVTIKKQLPPDAYAAHKYLTIIMREIWSENTNVNINHLHAGEITHKHLEEINLDDLNENVKDMLFDLNMKQLSESQHN